jgi:hypothetical protein
MGIKFENFNYAGIVTKILQPICPFSLPCSSTFFCTMGGRTKWVLISAAFGFLTVGGFIHVALPDLLR